MNKIALVLLQKYFTPTLGVNTKTSLIGFPSTPNKCSKFLLLSHKVLLQKRDKGLSYSKVKKKEKKRKKQIEKKMDKCPRYLKQWVLRCAPKKIEQMNQIAPALQQMFPNFKGEICFQGAQQNQVSHHTYIHHIHPHTCTS